MNEPKSMSVPDLEACINQVVKVYESTPQGEVVLEGEIVLLQIPWQMQLVIGKFKDGIWSGDYGQFCTFAGADGGITKIEKDGKLVYENKKIPIPYLASNPITEKGLAALNDLRRKCFGKGFDYIRGPV